LAQAAIATHQVLVFFMVNVVAVQTGGAAPITARIFLFFDNGVEQTVKACPDLSARNCPAGR
jgi:hypothetical protein